MSNPLEPFQPWELHLFGEVINSDYVSVGDAERAEKRAEIRWPALRVAANLTSQAGILRKVSASLLSDRLGIDYDDALGKVDTLSYSELDAAVVLVEDDKPSTYENGFPTPAGEDSTPT